MSIMTIRDLNTGAKRDLAINTRYTSDELLSFLRNGIIHHMNKGKYDKVMLQYIRIYAVIAGLIPAEKKIENVEYGDVMWVNEPNGDKKI